MSSFFFNYNLDNQLLLNLNHKYNTKFVWCKIPILIPLLTPNVNLYTKAKLAIICVYSCCIIFNALVGMHLVFMG
jgi:hypothetical protein